MAVDAKVIATSGARPFAAGCGFQEPAIQMAAALRLLPFPWSTGRSEAMSQFHSWPAMAVAIGRSWSPRTMNPPARFSGASS